MTVTSTIAKLRTELAAQRKQLEAADRLRRAANSAIGDGLLANKELRESCTAYDAARARRNGL